jgi:hypothetical protein
VLPDSNVYGPVLGLWSPSNPFHSPVRETLYSLPYPLRIGWHPDDRAVPHATKTFGAVIGADVAPEHVQFADTLNRPSQSAAVYRAKSRYRLRSRRASSLGDLLDIRRTLVPGASGRTLIDHDRVANAATQQRRMLQFYRMRSAKLKTADLTSEARCIRHVKIPRWQNRHRDL